MRYVGGGYIRNPVTRASQSGGGGRIPRAGWLKQVWGSAKRGHGSEEHRANLSYDYGKAVLCSDIHQRAYMKKRKSYRNGLQVKLAKLSAVEKNKNMSDNEIAAAIRGQDDFLKTEEWFKLKAATIAKHGWTCMKCKRAIKIWSHINVDHIKPRLYWPELKNDPDNLQILCGTCNREKGNSVADYR